MQTMGNSTRPRRGFALAGMLLLLLVTLACVCTSFTDLLDTGTGTSGSGTGGGTGGGTGSDSVTVVNNAQGEICAVFISDVDSDLWGDNFATNPIEPGQSETFNVASGDYDIRADDCSGGIMHSEMAVSVQGNVTFEVSTGGGPTAPVTLQNDSDNTVCFVLISPSGADYWGDDWLGDSNVIEPGGSHTFDVAQGDTDLQARDCDNNVLDEQTGVSITGSYQWVID